MEDCCGPEPMSSLSALNSITCTLDTPEIPKLIELYRPLIVQCVSGLELVSHLSDVIDPSKSNSLVAYLSNFDRKEFKMMFENISNASVTFIIRHIKCQNIMFSPQGVVKKFAKLVKTAGAFNRWTAF